MLKLRIEQNEKKKLQKTMIFLEPQKSILSTLMSQSRALQIPKHAKQTNIVPEQR